MLKKLLCLIVVACVISCTVFYTVDLLKDDSDSDRIFVDIKSFVTLVAELEGAGVDVDNSDEYDICLLIESIEDSTIASNFSCASNIILDEDIDEALLKHRKKVKDYYLSYNENMAEELGISEYDYCVSYFSPFIEIVFDDVNEYASCERDLIYSLQNNQDIIASISNCIIYEQFKDEVTINGSDYSINYPLDQAFSDIEVTDTQFTGQGVKVGVLESGGPQDTENLKTGYYTFLTANRTEHAFVVSSILGGTSGIAENVYFYFDSSSGFVNASNRLINDYNVNIINMSFGSNYCGYYTNNDACVDKIVSNTGCTIVKSAGNTSNAPTNPTYVTAPGCSMNAITVGSIDNNKNISVFSSWRTSNICVLKPDVVAPGGRLSEIPNFSEDNNIVISGTSLSAPMVTGMIALLMEEFPILKTNPALVKSVLHLGARKLPSQTDYFDEYSGFGLVNYEDMRACLLNMNYVNFNIAATASEGSTVFSYTTTIPYLTQIVINANAIVNSAITTANGTHCSPTYKDFSINIFDLETSTCVATSTTDSSFDYLIFINTSTSNSTFRIDIVLESDNDVGKSEACSFAYMLTPHSHVYSYSWSSEAQHKATCGACGQVTFEAHAVAQGAFPTPDGYAKCLKCRGKAFVGELMGNSSGELMGNSVGVQSCTPNGSYILPNGVIVLADQDVEAYMNGTLVFGSGLTE